MTWEEACECSSLEDMPFKIELDAEGNLVMSEVRVWHGAMQAQIGALLMDLLPGGKGAHEIGVLTSDNVKVLDVAWFTDEHWEAVKDDACCATAPAICVEVACGGDPARSFERKKPLYFKAGAQEVWFCDRSGEMAFYTSVGRIAKSMLCPPFPIVMDDPFTPPPQSRGGHAASAAPGR